MTVDKTIKLNRSDDQSITVSSGFDTFTITFCEVPRVSDNGERRFQHVQKPLADVNKTIEGYPSHYFPFTIHGPPTEGSTKDEKKGSGSNFIAIKDDKAFAIRIVGDSKESAFKVKVRVGGVNVLQHTTHRKKSQDYFVVSEQKWVWGKQVSKDTARQFRVFRRGRERLSLRYQLRNNNIKKEVEIEITSRRLARLEPGGLPPRMTLDGPKPSTSYSVLCSVSPSPPPEQEGTPKPPSDQESIHSDPEEDMLPHQMVVGTGGLIEQIVHPDKHPGPEWIDECTVTLKFKIVDPDYLKKEAGVKEVGILGGNYREVLNPPNETFRRHAPVVTDPDGLRRDIRSPMEMEMEPNADTRDGQPPKQESSKLPVDSGVGLVGDQEEWEEEEDVEDFQRLKKEAKSQPRGLMSDLRMKKESRKQRKRGGVRIDMVVKPEEPKGERKSRWRTFVDAMRRILTLGR